VDYESPTVRAGDDLSVARPRVFAVDALRGFDMFWIMGGDYLVRSFQHIRDTPVTRTLAGQMEHCTWAGFHFYDLIFPLFVWIVGVAIPFSVPGMIQRRGHAYAIRRIVFRSVLLFLLGIFYMGGVRDGFKNVYLAGVLHRIAVAYFFAAILFMVLSTRPLVFTTIALLVAYWALLTFVPVPGIGAASYEQGKNLAFYIDQRWMPGQKFEGTLLSTMPAVANCLLGVFAGLLLKEHRIKSAAKVLWLLAGGVILLSIGLLWSIQFPIIKLLWTSTYVLVACGISAILLGVFYLITDMWRIRTWAMPFVWIGMNAITIYVVANVVNFRKVADRIVGGDIYHALGGYGELVKAAVVLAMVLWLVKFLYDRRIFLRL
jgi:predicted acyltransferase